MKVLLADGILLDDDGSISPKDLQPQLGLISLISVIERAGHTAILYSPMLDIHRGALKIDGDLYAGMARRILRHKPDVIGFTTLGCNFIVTVQVAALLKQQAPELPIILGGPHATVLHETIMERFHQFDAIVRHEAEEKILALLDALKTGIWHDVSGVTWRDRECVTTNPGPNAVSDIETLPFPAYTHFPIEELQPSFLRIEAGRGCPFSCTFCSTATFFGRIFRLKSSRTIRSHIELLRQKYGVTRFSLQHDLFTVNRKKVIDFCDRIRDVNITWTCSARIDCVDKDLLWRMGEAGCRAIYYGIETGSARMQQITQKHLDLSLLFPRLDESLQAGITPTVSFIVGYPQETRADLNETLDLLGMCVHKYRRSIKPQLHLLTPEPGTALVDECKELLRFDGHTSDFNFPLLSKDDESIMKAHPDVFLTHFYYEGLVERDRNILITSAFRSLLDFGQDFVAHLIEMHSHKLSIVMESLYDWSQTKHIKQPLSGSLLIQYLKESYGPDHYMVSCADHLVAAAHLRSDAMHIGKSVSGRKPRASKMHRAFRWSKVAAIMYSAHNSSAVLHMFENRQAVNDINDATKTDRGSFYLMILDNEDPQVVRNYVIDDATAVFMDLVKNSRKDSEVVEFASRAQVSMGDLERFRSKLAKLGCLEQSMPLPVMQA